MRALHVLGPLLSVVVVCHAGLIAPSASGSVLLRRAFRRPEQWKEERRVAISTEHKGKVKGSTINYEPITSISDLEIIALERAQKNEQLAADTVVGCWEDFLKSDPRDAENNPIFRDCVKRVQRTGVIPTFTPQMVAQLQRDINMAALECIREGKSKRDCWDEHTIIVNGKTLHPELGVALKRGEVPPMLNTAFKGARNGFDKVVQNSGAGAAYEGAQMQISKVSKAIQDPDAVAAWAAQGVKNTASNVVKSAPGWIQSIPKQPGLGRVHVKF
ncbi:MAG: hypothetical protein M1823_004496 [Watsoniomyces obsoletus]|nr:MAG: hypothetical protein M1823_004496 [Watsoniomyces obsoletus]